MFTHNINFTLRLIFAIIKTMKITLKENKIKNDIEVIIEYPEMSETVNRIEHAVKSVDNAVRCLDDDGNICFVRVSDIFYIESVENRYLFIRKIKSIAPNYNYINMRKNYIPLVLNKSAKRAF